MSEPRGVFLTAARTKRPRRSLGSSARVGIGATPRRTVIAVSFLDRLKTLSRANPFAPFRLAAANGEAWTVETRECLTFDASDSMVRVMFRTLPGWRTVHVRVAQLVSIDLVADGLES